MSHSIILDESTKIDKSSSGNVYIKVLTRNTSPIIKKLLYPGGYVYKYEPKYYLYFTYDCILHIDTFVKISKHIMVDIEETFENDPISFITLMGSEIQMLINGYIFRYNYIRDYESTLNEYILHFISYQKIENETEWFDEAL